MSRIDSSFLYSRKEQTARRQAHRYREHGDGPRGAGWRAGGGKVKGLRSTDGRLQNSPGCGVQLRGCSHNTVGTTDGVRRALEIPGGHSVGYGVV